MMAAGRAAETGARVLLLEKNQELGVKLLATGGGRCNFSNKQETAKSFIETFGAGGKFLFSAYSRFDSADTVDFFSRLGVLSKIEVGGRIFPKSNRAGDILGALSSYLKAGDVEIRTGVRVVGVEKRGRLVKGIKLKNGLLVKASNYIIAVGGCAYPQTGSEGDGYSWARSLGHEVFPPAPALAPLILKDRFIKALEGLSFSGALLNIFKKGKKIFAFSGDIIFTADGLSGPVILDASRVIARERGDNISLTLDFFPDNEFSALDRVILSILQRNAKKTIKNTLSGLFPERFLSIILSLLGIFESKQAGELSREERRIFVRILKDFPLTFKAVAGFDKAYLSIGGISLKEIDPKTMKSKLFDNLYFAGEILDLDGPTGGYNLQICWSTGHVAGESAV